MVSIQVIDYRSTYRGQVCLECGRVRSSREIIMPPDPLPSSRSARADHRLASLLDGRSIFTPTNMPKDSINLGQSVVLSMFFDLAFVEAAVGREPGELKSRHS